MSQPGFGELVKETNDILDVQISVLLLVPTGEGRASTRQCWYQSKTALHIKQSTYDAVLALWCRDKACLNIHVLVYGSMLPTNEYVHITCSMFA